MNPVDTNRTTSPILPPSPLVAPPSASDQLQSVFSEILQQVGRDGYASADPLSITGPSSDQPLELNLGEAAQQSWSSWFQTAATTRYAPGSFDTKKPVDPTALKQGYANILGRAYESGGYADPKSFLSGLSQEDLEIVQHVQRLARPIQVDGLTEEGALNLLIPPPAQVDLNFDGLTQTGAGFGIRFPDSRTPRAVADAWEEATADLPLHEKMIYELQMKLPLLTANIITNADGQVVRVREPGDADFVNPLANPDYSYNTAAQNMLDYLDAFQSRMSVQQYETQHEFWSNFQQALGEHGAK